MILCTAGIVSHTQRHERRLEKTKMSEIKPKEKLLQGKNIWNLCVIDNINFKEYFLLLEIFMMLLVQHSNS